jgi:hypothetical protein
METGVATLAKSVGPFAENPRSGQPVEFLVVKILIYFLPTSGFRANVVSLVGVQ